MYHLWHRAIRGRSGGRTVSARTVQDDSPTRRRIGMRRRRGSLQPLPGYFLLIIFVILIRIQGSTANRPPTAVCTGVKNSCCSAEKEEEMVERAQRIFKLQLQDKVIILRHMLYSNLNSFRTYFYNTLNTCHNNLDVLFKKTYGHYYENNSKEFDAFFNRLRAFSSPYSDASVKSITNQLFSHLFRIMFSLLNPLQTITDSEYRCMEAHMNEIEPFGDLPQKVTAHLDKTLTTWRNFVAALDSAHQILDGFLNTTFPRQCVANLARMGECSQCSPAKEYVKPCAGFCLNVLNGCLAEWAEMDQQWDSVVGGILRLSQMLRGPQNLQGALGPLPVQLSEAIMIFQEKGSTVTNKVIAKCFPIEASYNRGRRYKRSNWLRSVAEQDTGHYRVARQLMTTFGDRLVTMRGWFRRLPESFCMEDGLAAGVDDRCWNGTAVDHYNLNVGLAGVNHQSSNPEYQGQKFLNYRGVFVEQRLQLGMLSFRLNNLIHGRNYTNYEVEGSAIDSDDEDYEDEGSGDVPIVILEPEDPAKTPQEHLVGSSRSALQWGVLTLLFLWFWL